MNVESRPVKDAAIAFRCERQNADLGEPFQECVTNMWALLGWIQRYNEEVGLGPFNRFKDCGLLLKHSNDFNVRLIGNRGKDQFPHQPGPICNQDFDCLHAPTLAPSIGWTSAIGEGSIKYQGLSTGEYFLSTNRLQMGSTCSYEVSTKKVLP